MLENSESYFPKLNWWVFLAREFEQISRRISRLWTKTPGEEMGKEVINVSFLSLISVPFEIPLPPPREPAGACLPPFENQKLGHYHRCIPPRKF